MREKMWHVLFKTQANECRQMCIFWKTKVREASLEWWDGLYKTLGHLAAFAVFILKALPLSLWWRVCSGAHSFGFPNPKPHALYWGFLYKQKAPLISHLCSLGGANQRVFPASPRWPNPIGHTTGPVGFAQAAKGNSSIQRKKELVRKRALILVLAQLHNAQVERSKGQLAL